MEEFTSLNIYIIVIPFIIFGIISFIACTVYANGITRAKKSERNNLNKNKGVNNNKLKEED